MILIYSNIVSNRLKYTLEVVFKHILKSEYKIVDLETFKNNSTNAKLNYSHEVLENCVQIIPCDLLFEENIILQKIEVELINGIPYFFRTASNNTLNHDILASIFYMTSRYEEYLPSNLDIHERFQAESSLAYKHGFLEIPIVNIWALKLKKNLLSKFPTLEFQKQRFKHINTFDIDDAYAYKGKNFFRLFASTLQSLLKLKTSDLKNRYNYLIKKEKDPYDTYSQIESLNGTIDSESIFFFLVGEYGKYDKNLPHTSAELRKLIKTLGEKNEIGIHPSYNSNLKTKELLIEKSNLESICNKAVLKSRQHYLKLRIPHTYENLISVGIQEDYTMGFASKIGFRAGICTPFPFFNLKKNTQEKLMIFPFQIMDGTLNDYLNLSPSDAIEKIEKIIDEVKKVDGIFISLWHNSSLSEKNNWKGWSKVYLKLIDLVKQK